MRALRVAAAAALLAARARAGCAISSRYPVCCSGGSTCSGVTSTTGCVTCSACSSVNTCVSSGAIAMFATAAAAAPGAGALPAAYRLAAVGASAPFVSQTASTYAVSTTYTQVIAPPSGSRVVLTFSAFVTEDPYDVVNVFADTTLTVALVSRASGRQSGLSVTGALNTPIVVQFTTDGSVNYAGLAFTAYACAVQPDGLCATSASPSPSRAPGALSAASASASPRPRTVAFASGSKVCASFEAVEQFTVPLPAPATSSALTCFEASYSSAGLLSQSTSVGNAVCIGMAAACNTAWGATPAGGWSASTCVGPLCRAYPPAGPAPTPTPVSFAGCGPGASIGTVVFSATGLSASTYSYLSSVAPTARTYDAAYYA